MPHPLLDDPLYGIIDPETREFRKSYYTINAYRVIPPMTVGTTESISLPTEEEMWDAVAFAREHPEIRRITVVKTETILEEEKE